MARSIDTIFNEMKAEGIRLATAAALPDVVAMFNNTSRVAIWKILFFACAFCIWTVEKLFDLHKLEVDDRIKRLKPGSPEWVAEMGKRFQYGYSLVPGQDYYDNTGLTDAQIEASRIIKHIAVVEQTRGIRIKVAKEVNGVLVPLSGAELTAFEAYMADVMYAGVKLLITTDVHDELKAALRIYYDAQVLTNTGARIDGITATPVQDAFDEYLKNLPFNGLFVPQLMIEKLKAVEGVVIAKDDSWQARYGNLAFAAIDVEYIPDAGYLRLAANGLTLQFIPHAGI